MIASTIEKVHCLSLAPLSLPPSCTGLSVIVTAMCPTPLIVCDYQNITVPSPNMPTLLTAAVFDVPLDIVANGLRDASHLPCFEQINGVFLGGWGLAGV